jgi:hypothetical protein
LVLCCHRSPLSSLSPLTPISPLSFHSLSSLSLRSPLTGTTVHVTTHITERLSPVHHCGLSHHYHHCHNCHYSPLSPVTTVQLSQLLEVIFRKLFVFSTFWKAWWLEARTFSQTF